MREKFGFAWQMPSSQLLGVKILAPMMYRLTCVQTYFLVHLECDFGKHGSDGYVEERKEDERLTALMSTAVQLQERMGTRPGKRTLPEKQTSPSSDFQESKPMVSPAAAAKHGNRQPFQKASARRKSVLFSHITPNLSNLDSKANPSNNSDAGSNVGDDSGNTAALAGKSLERSNSDLGSDAPDSPTRSSGAQVDSVKEVESRDPVGLVRMLQMTLADRLKEHVQDCSESVHIDVVLMEASSGQQRYVHRLQKRADMPNYFDGLLAFTEHDVGSLVEMHLHLPRLKSSAPLKIGQWTIIRKDEHFPLGF